MRLRLFVFLFACLVNRAHARPAGGFDWRRDTFSFSNDTVFAYGADEHGHLTIHARKTPVQYSHRCFVLARAAMQFHRFARFEPGQARVPEKEYARRVRALCRIPVWSAERSARRRIVFPGYADLHSFSRGHEFLLKQELGEWVPSYLRLGNWRMIFPFVPALQKVAAEKMIARLDRGDLQAVYISWFPWMNHCVVLYDHSRERNGDIRFRIYDPNYPDESGLLFFRAATRTFDFPKRWYWTGGCVNLMRVYISPFH